MILNALGCGAEVNEQKHVYLQRTQSNGCHECDVSNEVKTLFADAELKSSDVELKLVSNQPSRPYLSVCHTNSRAQCVVNAGTKLTKKPKKPDTLPRPCQTASQLCDWHHSHSLRLTLKRSPPAKKGLAEHPSCNAPVSWL